MAYSPAHQFLLRSIASRGVMSMMEIEQVLETFAADIDESTKDLINDINEQIRPFQQVIKITNDEFTSEEVAIFLSLGYDDATKSQNIFSATELEYFRILIEQIMTITTRQITGIHAMNLVSKMKNSFSKGDAQNLLKVWCHMRYLDKVENNYALGVRAVYEFEGYLRQHLPDTIEECYLCKQIVFRGCNCPSCGMAIHIQCLNKCLEKMQKWPCCRIDFSQSQLDQLNSDGQSQTQHMQQTQESVEYGMAESQKSAETNNQSTMEDEPSTHDNYPTTSQSVSRKRKRHED